MRPMARGDRGRYFYCTVGLGERIDVASRPAGVPAVSHPVFLIVVP